ncbi:hypothetical protein BT095_03385 [Corynebacterium diphtheriae]|nr:hypothetical protein BT095_03385 [Corynebacterium diphtheriae]
MFSTFHSLLMPAFSLAHTPHHQVPQVLHSSARRSPTPPTKHIVDCRGFGAVSYFLFFVGEKPNKKKKKQ